jgi:hypothetical protein
MLCEGQHYLAWAIGDAQSPSGLDDGLSLFCLRGGEPRAGLLQILVDQEAQVALDIGGDAVALGNDRSG